MESAAHKCTKSLLISLGDTQKERERDRGREGGRGVPRKDDLCYDNANVHVESWEGKKAPNIKNSKARWPMLRY